MSSRNSVEFPALVPSKAVRARGVWADPPPRDADEARAPTKSEQPMEQSKKAVLKLGMEAQQRQNVMLPPAPTKPVPKPPQEGGVPPSLPPAPALPPPLPPAHVPKECFQRSTRDCGTQTSDPSENTNNEVQVLMSKVMSFLGAIDPTQNPTALFHMLMLLDAPPLPWLGAPVGFDGLPVSADASWTARVMSSPPGLELPSPPGLELTPPPELEQPSPPGLDLTPPPGLEARPCSVSLLMSPTSASTLSAQEQPPTELKVRQPMRLKPRTKPIEPLAIDMRMV